MNILIIVQSRTTSTRFPNKILKPILGKPVLVHQIERIKQADTGYKVVVATSIRPEDDIIQNICEKENFEFFRGALNNLLDRHYKTAIHYKADVVVKIPSDCPLIDPKIIRRVIDFYMSNQDKYDYVSNLHPASYPDGNDVEVFPITVLTKAWRVAEKPHELEHTTPYIWENRKKFRIGNVTWETGLDYSRTHRFTLDYPEDYIFINNVYENLYPKNPFFSLDDILNYLDKNKDIMKINEKYHGEFWYNRTKQLFHSVKINEDNTYDKAIAI